MKAKVGDYIRIVKIYDSGTFQERYSDFIGNIYEVTKIEENIFLGQPNCDGHCYAINGKDKIGHEGCFKSNEFEVVNKHFITIGLKVVGL